MAAFDRITNFNSRVTAFVDIPGNNTSYDLVVPAWAKSTIVKVRRIDANITMPAGATTIGSIALILQNASGLTMWQAASFVGAASTTAAQEVGSVHYQFCSGERDGLVLNATPQLKWTITGASATAGAVFRQMGIDYVIDDGRDP